MAKATKKAKTAEVDQNASEAAAVAEAAVERAPKGKAKASRKVEVKTKAKAKAKTAPAQDSMKASIAKKTSTAEASPSSGTPSPKKKRESSTQDLSVTPEEPKAKKQSAIFVPPMREPIKVAKPTGGAFGVFLQEKGVAIKASLFDAKRPLSLVNQIAADRWKMLTDEEQKVFQQKYDTKLAAYKALPRSAKMGKTMKKQVRRVAVLTADGKEVKRQPGPYFIFSEERRESIKASLPADHKITDIAKEAAALWKAMPEEEKKVYKDKYEAKNAPYKEALNASKPQKAASGAPGGAPGGAETKVKRRKRKRAW